MCSALHHRGIVAALVLLLVCHPAIAADVKEVKLDKAQQEAVDKLRGKGAAVMQIAADTDSLAVNLGIIGKQATDADLELVKLLPKVQQLDLHNTAITDAGLASIAGQTAITHLHLNGTAVTDAGLVHLKPLASLEYLNLYNTAVTDEGLKNLSDLKKLQRLYLWQTKVTDAGAKAMKTALPTVVINRGEELALPPPPPPTEVKAADPKAKPTAVAANAKPINTKCPVQKDEDIDPSNTLVYEGKTIAFCCGNCPGAFKKDPKKYLVNIPAFTAAPSKEDKPADDKKPAPKAAAKSAGIDEEGFIRSWLLLGPIAIEGAAAEEIDKSTVPEEAKLAPKAGEKLKVGAKDLTWTAASAEEFFLDFNVLLKAEGENNVGVYAVAYVESPDEKKDVTLLMGSNDQGKLFLNGKELVKFTEGRSLEKDTEKAEGLTLKKGTNIVILKVISEANNWQGCVRIAGKDGKPIAGLKAKTAP